MKILTNYDFSQNQLINAVIQKLAIPPANPVSGQLYFDTAKKRLFTYNGNEWVGADSVGAMMTGESIVNAINDSASLINDDNLSQGVRDTIQKAHNTHSIANVTGLQDALDAKETLSGATAKASTAENNAKGYTDTKLAELVGSAPETLDTLNELAQALGSDPNFATTITNTLAQKTDKFVEAVGDNSSTSFVLTHNLNSRDVIVTIRETTSPYEQAITDIEFTTVNTITVKFAEPPTANQYTVTIIG